MNLRARRISMMVIAIMLLSVALTSVGQPAIAASVSPVEEPGNPNCVDDLGYDFGFKPQPEPPTGGLAYDIPGGGKVTIAYDGGAIKIFDWVVADLPPGPPAVTVAAVIVKGGLSALVYTYGAATSDTALNAPSLKDISHIEFCFDVGTITTVIELSAFAAQSHADEVSLVWETATENDNAGFHILRATSPEGKYEQVNEFMIAAIAQEGAGAGYSYADEVDPGVYYYKLVDVDLDSRQTEHGPVMVIVGGDMIMLPSIQSN